MNKFTRIFFCLVFTTIVLHSCESETELPDEPVINTIEFKKADTTLVINFTDGDGNFGLRQGDTLPPFQADEDEGGNATNRFHYNYWMDIYVKREGDFILFDPVGTLDFRIPVITPQGQNKQLRVEVSNSLGTELGALIGSQSNDIFLGDTVKFSVTLVDQDLNVSNTIETNPQVLEF
jgi:hypothetical protein